MPRMAAMRGRGKRKAASQVKLDAFVAADGGKVEEDVHFRVPFLPLTSPEEATPAAFRAHMPLYPHQQRSLHRMLQIESRDEAVAKFNFGHNDYFTKGGCLADAIGMGKTATMLALMASEPINVTKGANLVVAPSHLLAQWSTEVQKFLQSGEIEVVIGLQRYFAMDSARISNRTLVLVGVEEVVASRAYFYHFRNVYPRECTLVRHAVYPKRPPLIIEMDALAEYKEAALYVNKGYSGPVWVTPLHLPAKPWRRVVFEEVQDLVLPGRESQDCFIQLTRKAENVWLITATPFPRQADSIYANNQLLGFKRLRLRPDDPAFDDIKRKLYLRNCAQVTQDAIINRIKVNETYLSVKLHPKELLLCKIEHVLAASSAVKVLAEPVDELAAPTKVEDTNSDDTKLSTWDEEFLSARQACVHAGIAERVLARDRPKNSSAQPQPMSVLAKVKTPNEVFKLERYHLDREMSILKRRLAETQMMEMATRNTVAILQKIIAQPYLDVQQCFADMRNSGLDAFFTRQGETEAGFRMITRHVQSADRIYPDPADYLLYTDDEIEGYLRKHWDSNAGVQRLCSAMETTLNERIPKERKLLLEQRARLEECIALKQQFDARDGEHEAKIPYFGSKIAHLVEYVQRLPLIKVVVFSMWTTALRQVEKAFQASGISCAVFLEHQSSETKSAHVASFLNGDTEVLLLNSLTSASGINLQVASHVIFLDPVGKSPSQASTLEQQAIGRVLRMGQTNKEVSVVRLVAEQTLEPALYDEIHATSKQVAAAEDKFFDGTNATSAYVCSDFDQPVRRIVRLEIRDPSAIRATVEPENEDETFDIVGAMSLEEAITQRIQSAAAHGQVLDLTEDATESLEAQLRALRETTSSEADGGRKRRRMLGASGTSDVTLEQFTHEARVKEEQAHIKAENARSCTADAIETAHES